MIPDAALHGDVPDGAWPFPVRDELFGWPPAATGAVLVVGAARAAVLAQLETLGIPVRGAETLIADDLRQVDVVAFAGVPGTRLPAEAMAVAAAGRVLVVPRSDPAYGLTPWADHFAYDDLDDCAPACDAAVAHPPAYAPMTALARLAAEPYRASALASRTP